MLISRVHNGLLLIIGTDANTNIVIGAALIEISYVRTKVDHLRSFTVTMANEQVMVTQQ